MRFKHFKGLHSRHEASEWLEREDEVPPSELKQQQRKQPETVDLTACNTADAVTLDAPIPFDDD